MGRSQEAGVRREEPEGFEAADHTADVALRVWARDREGLFRQAALGLLRLLTDPSRVRPVEVTPVALEGLDLEELLVGWLNEILYLSDIGRRRFAQVDRLRIEPARDGFRLAAALRGEALEPQRHPSGVGVKAATYHDLHIDPQAADGYDLVIVLDM
jgi:SHS2 domain-containing protein